MIVKIEQVSCEIAENLCRSITLDLPQYFGLAECNEQYALGVQLRENFAVKVDENYVGLISIDFPYEGNANIYWMAVYSKFQNRGIGSKLIQAAVTFAVKRGAKTLTVETLGPS